MKKILSKILVCALLALLAVSTVSMYMPVSAATPAPTVSPMSYDEFNFSFTDRCQIGRNMAGMFMDVTVRGTAANNNNETIFLDVFVTNTGKTHSYTFLTDGQSHMYRNIFLGFSGGSNVGFTFRGANPEIQINMYLEMAS